MNTPGKPIDPELMGIYMERHQVGFGDQVANRLPLDNARNTVEDGINRPQELYSVYDDAFILANANAVGALPRVPFGTHRLIGNMFQAVVSKGVSPLVTSSGLQERVESDVKDLSHQNLKAWSFEKWAESRPLDQPIAGLLTAEDQTLLDEATTKYAAELQQKALHDRRLYVRAGRALVKLLSSSGMDPTGTTMRPPKASLPATEQTDTNWFWPQN